MNPEKEAMDILMMFGKGGKVMDSGGKDSTVLKQIAWKCHEKYGYEYEIVHNHTTIDAPETVYFVRSERERERERNKLHHLLSRVDIRPALSEKRDAPHKDSPFLLRVS